MALSPANKNKIEKILGVTALELDTQIDGLGASNFTAQDETDVVAEIARWDGGVSSEFVSVEPNGQNYGARFSSDDEKNDIRHNIAVLFQRPDWVNRAGGSVMQIGRG